MDSAGLPVSTFWRVSRQGEDHPARGEEQDEQRRDILVTVNAPGKVSGVGKALRVTQEGVAKPQLKLTGTQHGMLANGGKMTLQLRIRFAPPVGAASTVKQTIRF